MPAPETPDTIAAVKAAQMEGSINLIKERLEAGLAAVNATLTHMQQGQRDTALAIAELSRGQQAMDAHSTGLERLGRTIEENQRAFHDWCKAHTKDNDEVSDQVTSFAGSLRTAKWGIGIVTSLLLILGSMATYVFNLQVNYIKEDVLEQKLQHEKDIVFVTKIQDAQALTVKANSDRLNKLTGQTP